MKQLALLEYFWPVSIIYSVNEKLYGYSLTTSTFTFQLQKKALAFTALECYGRQGQSRQQACPPPSAPLQERLGVSASHVVRSSPAVVAGFSVLPPASAVSWLIYGK